MFVEEHLAQFKLSNAGEWKGARAPGGWMRSVGYKPVSTTSSFDLDQRHTRADLFRMRTDHSVATADICAAIFSWGGMQVPNGKLIFAERDWIAIADKLRSDLYDHIEGYREFFALSMKGKMPGCLPAFYSKLLYFFPGPSKRGVIMDQWTSRSVNLLTGAKVVRLVPLRNKAGGYRVAKENNDGIYAQFYDVVCQLADLIGTDIEDVELRTFSQGNGKGAWREYVVRNG